MRDHFAYAIRSSIRALATLTFFIPVTVVAQEDDPPLESLTGTKNPFDAAQGQVMEARGLAGVSGAPIETFVGNIIQGALSLAGVVFLILAVYAGYKWMTAQGDSDKITKAKDTLTAAIIGLAITLAAYAISIFVISRITTAAVG